jgi:hypothetical protein
MVNNNLTFSPPIHLARLRLRRGRRASVWSGATINHPMLI